MTARVGRRLLFPRVAPGWELCFDHRGGFGNIRRKAGDSKSPDVHGVLHRLAPDDWARLAAMEDGYNEQVW